MTFEQFAALHGVLIKRLIADGRIHRCGTEQHPKSKNGAYMFDGHGGWVWAWDGEGRAIGYRDPEAGPPSVEDKRRAEQRKRAVQEERAGLEAMARKKAASMLETARQASHGYLVRKGLREEMGLVLPDGALFVPMRDFRTDELLGAQVIRWLPDEMRWEKKYLWGMRSRGAVLVLGPRRPQETFLVEGWATGLSVDRAARQMRLNASVVVTFSAANLVHVAQHLGGRRYVIADHDAPQRDPEKAKVNPGCAGQRAAEATGLPWAMSDREGEDANDLHVRAGLLAVCQLLMRARDAAVTREAA